MIPIALIPIATWIARCTHTVLSPPAEILEPGAIVANLGFQQKQPKLQYSMVISTTTLRQTALIAAPIALYVVAQTLGAKNQTWLSTVIGVAAIVLSVFAGWCVSRSSGTLAQPVAVAKQIMSGNRRGEDSVNNHGRRHLRLQRRWRNAMPGAVLRIVR